MLLRERSRPAQGRRLGRALAFMGFLVLLIATIGGPTPSVAQRQPGALGTGFQVGRPGGLALKWYRSSPTAYDGIISTDGEDFIVGRLHRLWERPVPNSPLHLFVGPGLLVGPSRLAQSPRLRLGLSGEVGLNFYAERFEVFLHVTPTLRFLPSTHVTVDGNVGLRYYLRFP
ncbi:RNA polymerase subunit sigma-54 [Salinibacter altiplanensis]|uniref:RNA polymerase subunit sigma-54 n=1 Tax=Salinibacter altiplanensis TaxID=1803181 RepID=UPI001F169378|nr:RNA polymerase subunit sigma-54 [Salinibacter altiplanensis]